MNLSNQASVENTTKEVRKRLKYRSENFAIGKLVVVEFFTMLFALGPAAITWYATIAFVRFIWESDAFYVWLALLPAVVIVSFLVSVIAFRATLPRLKPGIYPIGTSRGFLTWLLTLYLGHAVRIAGLQPLFSAFYGLKYLYWRAMGANIAYGTNSSIFANFADYPMLNIDKGCTIGAFTFVCGHTFVGNKVVIAPVIIEKNVYVGYDSTIGPKTKLGEGAWIGAGNRLIHDTIEANGRLENFEWQHGSAQAKPQTKPQATKDNTSS